MNAAILVAGGSGQRMGVDKIFADLCGEPLLAHSLRAFDRCPEIDRILVVTRAERMDETAALCAGFSKAAAPVPGGAQRQDSVWNGLCALPDATHLVAVHDAARPLVTPDLITRCLAAAGETGAASCATPVTDTLKRADAGGRIAGGVDREGLWAMQTPQVFRAALLQEAYRAARGRGEQITDETSAVALAGGEVHLLPNGQSNFKVTFPRDLELARLVLDARRAGHDL